MSNRNCSLPSLLGSHSAGPFTSTATPISLVEQGKFTLHKFEQPIGEETYEIRRESDSLAVKVDFKFTDRGTAVPLSVTFKSGADLTPKAFDIKGRTARSVSIDESVNVENGKVQLRSRDTRTEEDAPTGPFFTIAGYAPTTMQMLMVRYWAAHGSPAQLATLPSGSVSIEPRGQDTIQVSGRDEKLDRYTIEGLIWGRETLWFDSNRNLVAAITTDAEFDHFEAIRDGYESALGDFVGRAGADGMAALADISKGIPGSRASTLAITGATLIDGTGAAPVQDAAVVIHKGRIVAAGPRAKVKIPNGAQIVDARGKTILPGLWDMHAHFEQVEWGPIYLAAGVTTVRDCGNELEFITAVRDAIAQGRGLGPRLLLAGIVDGSGPMAIGVRTRGYPRAGAHVDQSISRRRIPADEDLQLGDAGKFESSRGRSTSPWHDRDRPCASKGSMHIRPFPPARTRSTTSPTSPTSCSLRFPTVPRRAERRNAAANLDVDFAEAKKALAFLKEHHTVVDPTIALFELFTATTAKPPASFEPGINKIRARY